MFNKFLNELQEDILDGRGYCTLYIVLFIPTFFIEITEPKIYSYMYRISRVGLSGIALLLLILVHFRYKNSRNEEENKKIIDYIFIFVLTTLGSIIELLRI